MARYFHHLAFVVTAVVQLVAPPLPLASQTVAFVNVNVLPMDREVVVPDQTVVVRDGRIADVGPARRVSVPRDAVRIDGRGKYLLPGLAEMHGHLPNPTAAGTTPELIETVLFLYVANGVTLVRGMQGHPSQLELKARIARRELVGPRLWISSPPLSGNSVPTAADGRRLVEEYKAAGYDHLKIHEGLAPAVYDTIVATARRVGLPFAGHVPDAVGLFRVLEAGQATIDHLDNFLQALEADDSPIKDASPQVRAQQLVFHVDERKLPPAAEATRRAGAWVVPTLALWETFNAEPLDSLRARPELRYVPPQWRANWGQAVANLRQSQPDPDAGLKVVALRRKMLRAVRDAGAGILFGTDSPQLFSVPGFSIHREMQSMRAAGLTPYQILESATRSVAEFYGASLEFGTVATGRRADLVLLEANPLTDVANLARRAGVMVNGRWLPESEIQARLAQIAAGFGGP